MGDKKRSTKRSQIERPKAKGVGASSPHPGQRDPGPKTVFVHIKRRRTPVVEGKLFKIIEKSRKKNLRIFLTRGCVRTLRTLYGYATASLHAIMQH